MTSLEESQLFINLRPFEVGNSAIELHGNITYDRTILSSILHIGIKIYFLVKGIPFTWEVQCFIFSIQRYLKYGLCPQGAKINFICDDTGFLLSCSVITLVLGISI